MQMHSLCQQHLLSLISWRQSIEGVYKRKYTILEEWGDVSIGTVNKRIPVPKVVISKKYVPVSTTKLPLSRLSLRSGMVSVANTVM